MEHNGMLHIQERTFGEGRALLVAEIGLTHDGSLGNAHAFIDAVARTGADAVKFQTHIAAAESSDQEQFRVKFSRQDATRYDYWQRTEFTAEQWRGLKEHAEEAGLLFLSSPFSLQAVELLDALGMAAWKVAAGEVRNPVFLDRLLDTGKPILISTGLSSHEDIAWVVARIRSRGVPFLLYHTTSMYPAPPASWGLNNVALLRERYQCPAGLSDHSGRLAPAMVAAWEGAASIEAHVVFSRDMFGPDVKASLTIDEYAQLATAVREVETARANPVDKDAMARDMAGMRALFEKSLVAATDLPAGNALTLADLEFRKPGTGIPAVQVESYLGKRLATAIKKAQFLRHDDFLQS